MAHKTFISYKYSESQELRDRIIEALGDDGPLEKVCGYRSTIKILFCPFIKLNNG